MSIRSRKRHSGNWRTTDMRDKRSGQQMTQTEDVPTIAPWVSGAPSWRVAATRTARRTGPDHGDRRILHHHRSPRGARSTCLTCTAPITDTDASAMPLPVAPTGGLDRAQPPLHMQCFPSFNVSRPSVAVQGNFASNVPARGHGLGAVCSRDFKVGLVCAVEQLHVRR